MTKYRPQPPRQPRPAPVVPLSALRRSHGLTQPDVLARIREESGRRYTVGALSAVEKGHRGASPEFLADIAAVFGLEPTDLITDYEPRSRARDEEN